jgi:hypothetical protein
VATAIGGAVGDFVTSITETPAPSRTPGPALDAPSIAAPAEPYTNQASVDLVLTIPGRAVGEAGTVARLYLELEGQPVAAIGEQPVGTTGRLVFGQTVLTPGLNRFSATLVRDAIESAASAPVEYILDQEPPGNVLLGPADGATIPRDSVAIAGSTQPRAELVGRNDANEATVRATAGPEGTFEMTMPLEDGSNAILITATDPAGNVGQLALTVLRGSGVLTAELSASSYRIGLDQLPRDLELRVQVNDPDGRPLGDAGVTFTLQIPGLQATVSSTVTGADGTAVLTTTIPRGATAGGGLAAVLVEAGVLGTVRDQTVVTIE